MESEEENFSSHLSERLLVAEGGSESRTGGGLQAGGVGGGLLPRVWLQLPGLRFWRLDNTAHPPSRLRESVLFRSTSAKPFRSDKYTNIAEKMMEGGKEIRFQLVQEELGGTLRNFPTTAADSKHRLGFAISPVVNTLPPSLATHSPTHSGAASGHSSLSDAEQSRCHFFSPLKLQEFHSLPW